MKKNVFCDVVRLGAPGDLGIFYRQPGRVPVIPDVLFGKRCAKVVPRRSDKPARPKGPDILQTAFTGSDEAFEVLPRIRPNLVFRSSQRDGVCFERCKIQLRLQYAPSWLAYQA